MHDQLIAETKKWIDFANAKLTRAFEYPMVRFDKRGTTAGTANWRLWEVNFNMALAHSNGEAFLKRTVPHEVAHLVANAYYGKQCGHGIEWKHIMRLFGLEPTRCHSYDVSHCRARRTFRHTYNCNCGKIELGPKYHKIIQFKHAQGAVSGIVCRTCRKMLGVSDYVGQRMM